jgi:GDP-L-fucose synthase
MNKNSKIYIAWHRWLVWSAIVRKLEEDWYNNLIFKTSKELDLTDNNQVKDFFEAEKPEYVFLAAAKVWWILANSQFPADFIYTNLQIQNNIIHNSYLNWVKKLLFLGSSCIYPKECPQPMKEEYLLTWSLEPTNEPYAIAKITWIKMCQSYNRQYNTNYIACMPTNLYWPNDNFDLKSSHVLPAMIRKFHEAKVNWSNEVILWWDWTPMREFLYVDDMAEACIYLMNNFNPTKEQNKSGDIFVNIWTWKDITIKELAETVQKIVWFEWNLVWDTSKPNWTLRKLQDVNKLNNLGWKYKVELEEGIERSYDWFLENKNI